MGDIDPTAVVTNPPQCIQLPAKHTDDLYARGGILASYLRTILQAYITKNVHRPAVTPPSSPARSHSPKSPTQVTSSAPVQANLLQTNRAPSTARLADFNSKWNWLKGCRKAARLGKGLGVTQPGESALLLQCEHWLEATDPKHRYGIHLRPYYSYWLAQQPGQDEEGNPLGSDFFYWLDEGQGRLLDLADQGVARDVLEAGRVRYLTYEERRRCEIEVSPDGLLRYKGNANLVHTYEHEESLDDIDTHAVSFTPIPAAPRNPADPQQRLRRTASAPGVDGPMCGTSDEDDEPTPTTSPRSNSSTLPSSFMPLHPPPSGSGQAGPHLSRTSSVGSTSSLSREGSSTNPLQASSTHPLPNFHLFAPIRHPSNASTLPHPTSSVPSPAVAAAVSAVTVAAAAAAAAAANGHTTCVTGTIPASAPLASHGHCLSTNGLTSQKAQSPPALPMRHQRRSSSRASFEEVVRQVHSGPAHSTPTCNGQQHTQPTASGQVAEHAPLLRQSSSNGAAPAAAAAIVQQPQQLQPQQQQQQQPHAAPPLQHRWRSVDTAQRPPGKKEKCGWIYVMDTSCHIYVHKKERGQFHHSSFLSGAAVLAAGGLEVRNGRIEKLSAHSGHYRPDEATFEAFVEYLKQQGADLRLTRILGVSHKDKQGNSLQQQPQQRTVLLVRRNSI